MIPYLEAFTRLRQEEIRAQAAEAFRHSTRHQSLRVRMGEVLIHLGERLVTQPPKRAAA
jgi:hypothetical protein